MDEATSNAAGSDSHDRRVFRIADLLILIAFLAIGAGFARTPLEELKSDPPWMVNAPPISRVFQSLQQTYGCLQPFLAATTIAVLVIRFIPPRPKLRRLVGEPGFLACAAATLALAIGHLQMLPGVLQVYGRSPTMWLSRISIWLYIAHLCGMAVIGAWLGPVLGGRWSPPRDSIDRIGRILGIVWIGGLTLEVAAAWVAFAFW